MVRDQKNEYELQHIPSLVANFEVIRKRPHTFVNLDDLHSILSNKSYREHFFHEAETAWQYIFDPDKIAVCLSRRDEKSYRYLKQVRKFGNVLRSSYRAYSINHHCPDLLHDFLVKLGEYNDYYPLPLGAPIAEKILQARPMWESLNKGDTTLQYAETSSFQNYMAKMIKDILILLEKRSLSMAAFHSLRKKVRTFMNLAQIPAVEHVDRAEHQFFYMLYELSTKIGDVHRNFVKKDIRGKIDYANSLVTIDPDWQRYFLEHLSYIKKACGINSASFSEYEN